MIKAEIGCNGVTRVEARGTVQDLIYDTCVLICDVWSSIEKSDLLLADFYKYAMTRAFTDADSPLWHMSDEQSDGAITFIAMTKKTDGDRGCE